MLLFARPENLFPIAAIGKTAQDTCVKIQPWVISLAIGIHLVETGALHLTRLMKYGVVAGSLTWWAWMASCFIEGLPAFARADRVAHEANSKDR